MNWSVFSEKRALAIWSAISGQGGRFGADGYRDIKPELFGAEEEFIRAVAAQWSNVFLARLEHGNFAVSDQYMLRWAFEELEAVLSYITGQTHANYRTRLIEEVRREMVEALMEIRDGHPVGKRLAGDAARLIKSLIAALDSIALTPGQEIESSADSSSDGYLFCPLCGRRLRGGSNKPYCQFCEVETL